MRLLNQYYSYIGFCAFVGRSLKKADLPTYLVVPAIYVINKYVFTLDDGLELLTTSFSKIGILVTFFNNFRFDSSGNFYWLVKKDNRSYFESIHLGIAFLH